MLSADDEARLKGYIKTMLVAPLFGQRLLDVERQYRHVGDDMASAIMENVTNTFVCKDEPACNVLMDAVREVANLQESADTGDQLAALMLEALAAGRDEKFLDLHRWSRY